MYPEKNAGSALVGKPVSEEGILCMLDRLHSVHDSLQQSVSRLGETLEPVSACPYPAAEPCKDGGSDVPVMQTLLSLETNMIRTVGQVESMLDRLAL